METTAEGSSNAEFTRAEYRRLLRLAASHYPFASYSDLPLNGRFILWRHDVDISLQCARKLAHIEAEEHLKATYFLYLHSEFYNLFEQASMECVREILELGHDIGLHYGFDQSFFPFDTDFEEQIRFEASILMKLFQHPINAFSIHNPTLLNPLPDKPRYAGLINVYSPNFNQDIGYVSDSNGYYRFRSIEEVINSKSHERLQVLTHPGWWTDEVMSPADRIRRAVFGRTDYTLEQYRRLLESSNRENRGWSE